MPLDGMVVNVGVPLSPSQDVHQPLGRWPGQQSVSDLVVLIPLELWQGLCDH